MLRLLIPSILFAFILVSLGSRTASAEQVTGCLTAQGAIKDLAIGDAPAKPCKASATQISLPLGLETFELLDDNGLPIGTVLNVESPGRVTVLVEFPFHPRAIILRSRTEFGVSFFQSEKPFELRAWFAQEDCVGTAYGEPTNVVRTRTPTVEAAFVGKDNLGATRLYVGEEVVTTVEVVVVSQLTEIGCDNFGVKPLDDWAPLILLDPDLLSTGIARARAEGKTLGRPRVSAEVEDAIRDLRAEGSGMTAISKALGVGCSTVTRVLAE